MIFETFPTGPLQCNCTIVGDETTKKALVIDPGGNAEDVERRIRAHGLTVTAVLHTHTHFDHVGASGTLQKSFGAEARIHEEDLFLFTIIPIQAELFRVPKPDSLPELNAWLRDDEAITLSDLLTVHVLHTPGHTPGSCCFEVRTSNDVPVVLAGDTLFRHGIGRTDLWGGDAKKIHRSIRDRLLVLPETTRVIAGHGPETTIGDEIRDNFFLEGE
jgi:hydroxyacylglutathione hydrolase